MLCSCESQREKKAIEICQETKIQVSLESPKDGSLAEFLGTLVSKASFAIMGLDYETSTWLDFANKVAEINPSEKFHWKAQKTDVKNIYQVGFVNEEDWGHFWEVDIKEKIVKFIDMQDIASRNYGHSRLDDKALFKVKDIEMDTLKRTKDGISYKIQGRIVNETGKALSFAEVSGTLSVLFENRTEKATSISKYNILERRVTETKPWHNKESIKFSIQTESIKNIYLEYDPEYVFFTMEMDASDPIGYTYDKAIYEVDMKKRWNVARKCSANNKK